MATTEAILRRRAKNQEAFDSSLKQMIHEALSEQGNIASTAVTNKRENSVDPVNSVVSEELLSKVINQVFDRLSESKADSPNVQCPTINAQEIADKVSSSMPEKSEVSIDLSTVEEGFSSLGNKIDNIPSSIVKSINERLAELKDGIDLSTKADKCEASYQKIESISTPEKLLSSQNLDRVALSDLKDLISHTFLISVQRESLSEVYANYESLQSEYDGNSRKKIRNTKFNEKTQEKSHYLKLSSQFDPVLSSLDEHIKGLDELIKTFFKSSTTTYHQAAINLKELCSDFKANTDLTEAVDDYCSLCSTNVEYSNKPETTYLCGLNIICEELI